MAAVVMMRLGAVGGAAVYLQLQHIGGGVHFSVTNSNRSCGICGVHVQAHDTVHMGVIQTPGLDHTFCAAGIFFVGLKEELYRA